MGVEGAPECLVELVRRAPEHLATEVGGRHIEIQTLFARDFHYSLARRNSWRGPLPIGLTHRASLTHAPGPWPGRTLTYFH